jgi:hypothetical protein
MKSQVEASELEFLVERLCLATSVDMASTFFEAAMVFEAAKIEPLSALTNIIKTSRFPTLQEARTMGPVANPTPIEESSDSTPPLAIVVPRAPDPWGGRTR